MVKQIEEFKQLGIMVDLSLESTYRTLGERNMKGYSRWHRLAGADLAYEMRQSRAFQQMVSKGKPPLFTYGCN